MEESTIISTHRWEYCGYTEVKKQVSCRIAHSFNYYAIVSITTTTTATLPLTHTIKSPLGIRERQGS